MNEEWKIVKVTRLVCEFCDKQMTKAEHDFCDICSDCREESYE